MVQYSGLVKACSFWDAEEEAFQVVVYYPWKFRTCFLSRTPSTYSLVSGLVMDLAAHSSNIDRRKDFFDWYIRQKGFSNRFGRRKDAIHEEYSVCFNTETNDFMFQKIFMS